MGKSICGADCASCPMNKSCKGCCETGGCPFGKQCFIAKYISVGGKESYLQFKRTIIDEINDLKIPGMPLVEDLNPLVGRLVNLEYHIPGGSPVRVLDDNSIYLGNQLVNEFDDELCFGVVAGMDFLIVCSYDKAFETSELLIYKKR